MSDTTDLRGYTWPPISDAIDSPDSGVVASSLAVSKVNTKADEAMAQAEANMVPLSSSLESTSETTAATSLAVKTLKDVLDATVIPVPPGTGLKLIVNRQWQMQWVNDAIKDVSEHEATHLPYANTIMTRDARGRTRVEPPVHAMDAVNKEYVDGIVNPFHIETFTTSGTYTPPKDGVVLLYLVGGGQTGPASGNGAPGLWRQAWLNVFKGRSYSVTVGAGGASDNGSIGGDTFFYNKYLLAKGGSGGSSANPNPDSGDHNGFDGTYWGLTNPKAGTGPWGGAGGVGFGAGGGHGGDSRYGGVGAPGLCIVQFIG